LGPITYDMVSLLRDAFVSWDDERVLDWSVRYWEKAKRAGLAMDTDFAEFWRAFEWMGLQRHLKVLGIFARISYRDGKPKYLADMPRFIGYARAVSERYAALAPLARLLDELERRPCPPRRAVGRRCGPLPTPCPRRWSRRAGSRSAPGSSGGC